MNARQGMPHIDSHNNFWRLFSFTVTTKTRGTTGKDWRVISAVSAGGLFVILAATVVIWRNRNSQLHEYTALKHMPPKQ